MEPVTVALAAIARPLDKEHPSAAAVESPPKPSQKRIMSVDVEMTAPALLKERPASVALRYFSNEWIFFVNESAAAEGPSFFTSETQHCHVRGQILFINDPSS